MKVSEHIFSSDIFLGSRIAGGTGGARRKAACGLQTDMHACMGHISWVGIAVG